MLERLRGLVLKAPSGPLPDPELGGVPWADLYPSRAAGQRPRAYTSLRSVSASLASVLVAPANAARRSLTVVNDSTADLYLAFGPIASSAMFSLHVGPGATAVLEGDDVYQGDVAGAWSAAAGAARVSEAT